MCMDFLVNSCKKTSTSTPTNVKQEKQTKIRTSPFEGILTPTHYKQLQKKKKKKKNLINKQNKTDGD